MLEDTGRDGLPSPEPSCEAVNTGVLSNSEWRPKGQSPRQSKSGWCLLQYWMDSACRAAAVPVQLIKGRHSGLCFFYPRESRVKHAALSLGGLMTHS